MRQLAGYLLGVTVAGAFGFSPMLISDKAARAQGLAGASLNSEEEAQAALRGIFARIASGEADPIADAAQAIRAGRFGIIGAGQHSFEGGPPPGLICFTPSGLAPDVYLSFRHGDAIDQKIMDFLQYAESYNRILVDHPDFPGADLCRTRTEADRKYRHSDTSLANPARIVTRPIRTLHEAARRGSARDLRRFLSATDVDALDGVKMTALAWAVARNNFSVFDQLLKAKADPWAGGPKSSVYWAAALGRKEAFRDLERRPGRPFQVWPAEYLRAAIAGGESTIIQRILSQPHAMLRSHDLRSPLPLAASLELVLKERPPGLADALLLKALTAYNESRLDLVRLALAYGANPNATQGRLGSETALGIASSAINPIAPDAVDLLLKAGADVNFPSFRARPVWWAVRTLKLDREYNEIDAWAQAIFDKLVAAGADLNLADDQDRPPIWFLLFPMRHSPEELDSDSVTPQLLEMLVRNGMDINAPWRGQHILSVVEAKAGRNSPSAATLRRLGAQ